MQDKKRDPPAALITSVPKSRFQQLDDRRRRYLISMGIRTICLLLAIVVPFTPARILLVVAAIALPWLSVVAANGPLARDPARPTPFRPRSHPALGPGTTEAPDADRRTG